MFFKTAVPEIFQMPPFIKVAGIQPVTLKKLWDRCSVSISWG